MKYFLALIFSLFAIQAGATVKYDTETRSLTISGVTTNWQWQMVRDAFDKNQVDTVFMDGPGGLFYAGLQIGREIKEGGARVIIPSGKECTSACAIAALAASEILVDGVLLFHRPFMGGMESGKTLEQFAGETGISYMDLANYILEMGFPLSFTKFMIAETSPCLFIAVRESTHINRIRGEALDRPNLSFERVNKCNLPEPAPR